MMNFVGADMDIMREIAKRMGVEVEFQDLGFDALVTAVKEGKVDAAIAAMAATDGTQGIGRFFHGLLCGRQCGSDHRGFRNCL